MNNSKIIRFVNYSFVITTTVAVIAVLYLFFTKDNVGGIASFGEQLETIITTYIMVVFTPLAVLYITGKEYNRAFNEQRVTHFFTSLLNGILISAGIGIIGEAFILTISRVFKLQCYDIGCMYGKVLFFMAPLIVGSLFTLIFALLFHFLSQRYHTVNQTITETTLATKNYSAPKSRVMWYLSLFIIVILSIFLLLWLTVGASPR